MKFFIILQFIIIDTFIICSFINENKENYKQNKKETIQINEKFYKSVKFYDCKHKLLDKLFESSDAINSNLLKNDYDSLYNSQDTIAIFYACDNLR